jgi:hypothetical protein
MRSSRQANFSSCRTRSLRGEMGPIQFGIGASPGEPRCHPGCATPYWKMMIQYVTSLDLEFPLLGETPR